MFLQISDFIKNIALDLFLYSMRIYSILEIKYNKITKCINSFFIKNKLTITSYYDKYNNSHVILNNYNNNVLICRKDKLDYELSNISFININFILNDIIYPIDLKKPFNYYIIENILDNSFFNYYLTDKYTELKKVNLDNGILEIIDNTTKVFEIKPFKDPFKIKIQKNGYELII